MANGLAEDEMRVLARFPGKIHDGNGKFSWGNPSGLYFFCIFRMDLHTIYEHSMNLVFVVSFHTEELGKHLSIKGFHKENMLNPATTNWEFAKKNGARKNGGSIVWQSSTTTKNTHFVQNTTAEVKH